MADVLTQWRETVCADLELLALLHDREPDAGLLARLKDGEFPRTLGLRLTSGEQRACADFMAQSLAELPAELEQSLLDELAADFAAIYLNHGIQASPCESVWLDEEHLTRQQPMFQVREWYKQYGLRVEDWRLRADDHLVCQLLFIAHLLKSQHDEVPLQKTAQFLDEHLLLWLQDFAAQVSRHAGTAYYAGLALLTAAYVERLRELLAALGGESAQSLPS